MLKINHSKLFKTNMTETEKEDEKERHFLILWYWLGVSPANVEMLICKKIMIDFFFIYSFFLDVPTSTNILPGLLQLHQYCCEQEQTLF